MAGIGWMRSPGWSRDFRLHFSARVFSVAGSQGTYIAFPLLALTLFSPAQAALVAMASYGSTLLVGLPAGGLADRRSRRQLMIWAEVIQLLAMVSLVGAILVDQASLPLVCTLSFLNGAMHAVFSTASSSAIPDLLDRDHLAGGLSAAEGRNAALSIAGPLVGATLYAAHPAAPFGLAALTFAASVLLLVRMKNPLVPGGAEGSPTPRLRHGLAVIARHHVLQTVIVAQALLSFVLTGSFFTVLALLTDQGRPVGAGVVTALIGVGLLLGSTFAVRLAPQLRPVLAVGVQASVWAAAMGLIALWPGLMAAGTAMALMWLIVPTTRVTVESWVADHIATGQRGRVQALRSVTNAVASPLGPAACGVLITSFGYTSTLGVLAGVSSLAALTALLHTFPARRRRRP